MNIIDLFFPNYCYNCNAETNFYLCPSCYEQIKLITEFCTKCGKPLDSDVRPKCTEEICGMDREVGYFFEYSRSAVCLNDVVTKIIHEFKYRGKKRLLRIFEPFLKTVIEDIFDETQIDYIVPVPMHFLKRLFRPYNQAKIIAKYIGEITGTSVVSALKRVRYTKMQAGMDFRARQRNVRGVFKTNKKVDFSKKNVLLVDDIITTGYTVNECARALKKARAKEVVVMTLARH